MHIFDVHLEIIPVGRPFPEFGRNPGVIITGDILGM